MNLLFDQNISFRIIKKIEAFFPDAKQVIGIGLENASDSDIWSFAKNNSFVIVTFDADFADIANIQGCPPKIIWLRTGNLSTDNIVKVIKKHQTIINAFIKNDEYKEICCLEIE